MTSDDKLKALELAVAQLDKQYGKGSIVRLGTEDIAPWPSISTGAFSLDLALGIGGLPFGRIVEIIGPASVGKSSICLSVVAEAQKQGFLCAYIDVENALDPNYMKALGVDLGELWLSQPDYGEQALDIVDKLVKSGAISVIIVDSVAALVAKDELDAEMGKSFMGLQARMMSQAMRKLSKPVADNNVLLIFINQIREKIGVMFGSPEVSPGGRALGFYASVRIDLRKKEDVKEKADGSIKGVRVKAKVTKNKMAAPLKVAEFDILYGRGPNNLGCIVDLAQERNILTMKGAGWYSFEGQALAQGRDNLIDILASDLAFADKLKELIISG